MTPENAQQKSSGRPCPTCAASAPDDGPYTPFCSERCRLADLGRWFDGRYVVSREATPDDLDDPRLTRGGADERE